MKVRMETRKAPSAAKQDKVRKYSLGLNKKEKNAVNLVEQEEPAERNQKSITLIDDKTNVVTEAQLESKEQAVVLETTKIEEPVVTTEPEGPASEEYVTPAVKVFQTERPKRLATESADQFAERIREFYRSRWDSVTFADITQEEAAYLEQLGGEKETYLFGSANEMMLYRDEVNPFELTRGKRKSSILFKAIFVMAGGAACYFAASQLTAIFIARNLSMLGG